MLGGLLRNDGLVSSQERDQEWAAMYTVAERMTAKYERQVKAVTRRRGFRVTQGLALKGAVEFEPVRQRRMLSRRWHGVQPVGDAASRLGAILRETDRA